MSLKQLHRGLRGLPVWAGTVAVLAAGAMGCDDDSVQPVPRRTDPRSVMVRPGGNGDFATIQEAIDSSIDGDTIILANGRYRGPGNRDIDYQGLEITIHSQGNNPIYCVIDCESTKDDPHRGFWFHSGETEKSILQSVRVEHGEIYGGGGAVQCVEGSSPRFNNVIFEKNGNTAVLSQESSPAFYECQFLSNQDGALSAWIDCSILLIDCEFKWNFMGEGSGAAISNVSSHLTMIGCLFQGNGSQFSGGAVHSSMISEYGPASLDVLNCTFLGNIAGYYGGAVDCSRSSALIEECAFVDNEAGVNGGAIQFYRDESDGLVRGSVFFDNSAVGGAALSCGWEAIPRIEETIIAFNRGSEAIRCDQDSGAHLVCCDVFGNDGGDWIGYIETQLGTDGNISADPLFCDQLNADLRLREDSPCVASDSCGWMGPWRTGCSPPVRNE